MKELASDRISPVPPTVQCVRREIKLEEGTLEESIVSEELLSTSSSTLCSLVDVLTSHPLGSSPVDMTVTESPCRVMVEGSEELKLNSSRSGGGGAILGGHPVQSLLVM